MIYLQCQPDSTIMQESVKEIHPFYIVFASGTGVFDENGRLLVKCPTEDEAVEWIKENGGNTDGI